MTKQPEALRLADLLDLGGDATRPNHWEAAAELRRLYEVNAELLEALKLAQTIIGFGKEWDQIDAAIAKAEVTK
jgi:dihydropteroate synthase